MSSVALSLTVHSQTAASSKPSASLVVLGASRGPDLTFRPFFIAALLIGVSAGAAWGTAMLLQAAVAGRFTAVSIWQMNAHAHAQIYGFVTLMIMGFGYQAFPRFWATTLAAPRLGGWVLLAMLAGITLQSVGWFLANPGLTPWLSGAGGTLEAVALATFFIQLVLTRRRSSQPMDVSTLLVLLAAGLMPLHAISESLHAIVLVGAESRSALLTQLADWQTPLRGLQLRATVLFMIVGVTIRVLPRIFSIPPVPEITQRRLLSLMIASLISETTAFVLMRQTGQHAHAASLMLAWIGWCVVAVMLFRQLRVRQRWTDQAGRTDRPAPFIRAAFGWLVVWTILLLFTPVHRALSGLDFSHSYYGATRHALTGGFITFVMMGFALQVIPSMMGIVNRNRLRSARGPFLLLLSGASVHVIAQAAADTTPWMHTLLPAAGFAELAALLWLAAILLNEMLNPRLREP